MKYPLLRIISLAFFCLLLSGMGRATERTVEFFISKDGNDSYSGILPAVNGDKTDGPFATLERARDAVRQLKRNNKLPEGGVLINIRAGTYQLEKTFELNKQDSGAENSPIIYRAYKNERVRLIGGRGISDFKPVVDPDILKRIAKPYHDKILHTDLKRQGITDFGAIKSRGQPEKLRHPAGLELFFYDKPMQLARWPNDGWVRIVNIPKSGSGKIIYEGDRPARWIHNDDIWLHGYWTWDWADSYEKVAGINTDKKEFVMYKLPTGGYFGGYSKGGKYYALNILEELDAPGEWYLDRKNGMLYFWPPVQINDGEALVSLLETIIRLRDVSYVTIQGLEIGICRGTAIKIEGGSNNSIADCILRNIGNYAVSIEGGSDNGVARCEISYTGDGGIILSGGDRKTLTPAKNYARNNHIYNFSRWVRTSSPAITIEGVGNRVSNNVIHDAPHLAISLNGNDHIVEFNEVYNVGIETNDVGAFYMTGMDYSERGNIVRYNYFHDLTAGDIRAVYLDGFSSGTLVFGNIFYNVNTCVNITGGRDNIVQNNVFIDCRLPVLVRARGLTGSKRFFDGTDTILIDRLEAVKYKEPPYSIRYPELLTLYDDNPAIPKGNKIIYNIVSGDKGKWITFQDDINESVITINNNFFVKKGNEVIDSVKKELKLKEDIEIYNHGFQRVPFEKIGLRYAQ